jgi:hypothetical protein
MSDLAINGELFAGFLYVIGVIAQLSAWRHPYAYTQGRIKVFGGPGPEKLRDPSPPPPLLFSFSSAFIKFSTGFTGVQEYNPGKYFEITDGCR